MTLLVVCGCNGGVEVFHRSAFVRYCGCLGMVGVEVGMGELHLRCAQNGKGDLGGMSKGTIEFLIPSQFCR